jgi:hypothetical protein
MAAVWWAYLCWRTCVLVRIVEVEVRTTRWISTIVQVRSETHGPFSTLTVLGQVQYGGSPRPHQHVGKINAT